MFHFVVVLERFKISKFLFQTFVIETVKKETYCKYNNTTNNHF